MKYFYMVDTALQEDNLKILSEEEFQDSLNFNLDEAVDNGEMTEEETSSIIDMFNEMDEMEEPVNGFVFGVTLDKDDLVKTYSLKTEEVKTEDCNAKDSQAQEISNEYKWLSEKYGVDLGELVYGENGFMKSCYPESPNDKYTYFPDFDGDVIYSKKHWDELVEWAKKERGIDLTLKKNEDEESFDDIINDEEPEVLIDIEDDELVEEEPKVEENIPFNQDISYSKLADIFYEHNSKNGIEDQFGDKNCLYGNVVISQDSFKKPYTEEERTYVFRSDNKAFLPNEIGSSVFADSKDGSDTGIRLDLYLWDGWKIERCYITEEGFGD